MSCYAGISRAMAREWVRETSPIDQKKKRYHLDLMEGTIYCLEEEELYNGIWLLVEAAQLQKLEAVEVQLEETSK